MKDPSAHTAHDYPLVDRLIDDLIGDYIATAAETALAANGYVGAEAQGYAKAVDQMRHLYLSVVGCRLRPRSATYWRTNRADRRPYREPTLGESYASVGEERP